MTSRCNWCLYGVSGFLRGTSSSLQRKCKSRPWTKWTRPGRVRTERSRAAVIEMGFVFKRRISVFSKPGESITADVNYVTTLRNIQSILKWIRKASNPPTVLLVPRDVVESFYQSIPYFLKTSRLLNMFFSAKMLKSCHADGLSCQLQR